jgi:hypothetical protein
MLHLGLIALLLSASAYAASIPAQCAVSLHAAPSAQELRLRSEPKYRTVPLLPRFRGEESGIWLNLNGHVVWWSVDHFDAAQREAARVILKDGRVHDASGTPSIASGIFIFTMDAAGNFFMMPDRLGGAVHHSTPLAGSSVAGAGEWVMIRGKVFARNRKSGHYDPPLWSDRQVANELIDGGAAEIGAMTIEDMGWGTFVSGDGTPYSRAEIEAMIQAAAPEQP